VEDPQHAKLTLRPKRLKTSLKFERFDEQYVRRLAEGDSAAENHFASYFGKVLSVKLRVRLHSPELIEEVRQETLLRVLAILRQGDGVRLPERFGAFVNAVCNNVMKELCRSDRRHEPWDQNTQEPVDQTVNLDAPLVTADLRREIEGILGKLVVKDREILRALFLDEIDKSEVCRRHRVDSAYLRVLLHRAKSHFRAAYGGRKGPPPVKPNGG